MQRSVNDLVGYKISAKDGELGKVNEFYFDDLTWSIRYLVVETGNWLSEKKVLIPQAALSYTDWKSKTFHVNITMEQVRNSPDFESEKTVSRQHETELFQYYAFPFYWEDGFYIQGLGMLPIIPNMEKKSIKEQDESALQLNEDPHLRSTKKIKGYFIHATDGEIGHVHDYIVDDEKWNICFLIVDTHNWLPGRKVLISPRWINRIDWNQSRVYINHSKEAISKSPEFDTNQPIGKDYGKKLFSYYSISANLYE
jgi:sporulation protein YlmC with PRC-barrel domain